MQAADWVSISWKESSGYLFQDSFQRAQLGLVQQKWGWRIAIKAHWKAPKDLWCGHHLLLSSTWLWAALTVFLTLLLPGFRPARLFPCTRSVQCLPKAMIPSVPRAAGGTARSCRVSGISPYHVLQVWPETKCPAFCSQGVILCRKRKTQNGKPSFSYFL